MARLSLLLAALFYVIGAGGVPWAHLLDDPDEGVVLGAGEVAVPDTPGPSAPADVDDCEVCDVLASSAAPAPPPPLESAAVTVFQAYGASAGTASERALAPASARDPPAA